jgi:hypothetical protein
MKSIISITLLLATVAAPATFAGEIRNREQRQQGRIAQGIASGRLGPGQAAHLERHESYINHEVSRDRFRDGGGPLTYRQRAQINGQQNYLSHEIYRDKHSY